MKPEVMTKRPEVTTSRIHAMCCGKSGTKVVPLFLLSFICVVSFQPTASFAQISASRIPSRQWADSALTALRDARAREHAATVQVTEQLIRCYASVGDPCRLSEVYGLRSASLTQIGQLDSALVCAQRALDLFPMGCDSTVLMRGYLGLARLDIELKDFERVDSVCGMALGLWNPKWDARKIHFSLLTNQAIAQANLGKMKGAQSIFRTILRTALMDNSPQDVDDAIANLGAMKMMLHETDSAEYYYRVGLRNALSQGQENRVAIGYSNLAYLMQTRKLYLRAAQLADSGIGHAMAAGDLPMQVKLRQRSSINYGKLGDYQRAFDYAIQYSDLNDSLLNTEKVKSMSEMQTKYESEKKAKEILGLRADMLDAALVKSRLKRTRNIYLFSGLGVLGLSVGLWNTLRRTRKSRTAIQKEKDISEGLLLNILPEQVAEELKRKGYADAQHFDQATILFTDFKGFTQMSEKLSPAELVGEIDTCFKAFDGIISAAGIEKIKTIGDAYMAAGGLPVPTEDNAHAVVRAALAMNDFMRSRKAQLEAEGKLYFEMRVGIHTGPVIAGIVGVKKFAYDIWGDTVNIASRMESSGEVGMVNISESTYALIKEAPDLRFTPRGMVQAKGKGELAMFFVEAA